jgi:hypothetical protein
MQKEATQTWKATANIAVHDRNAKDNETGEIAGIVDTQQAAAKAMADSEVATMRMHSRTPRRVNRASPLEGSLAI